MKYQLLLITTLLFSFLTKAQNLTEKKLMGEWETIAVEISNKEDIPQKDAIQFMENAFLGSKFNFKGNRIFKIDFGSKADDRIKKLFALDETNWKLDNESIKIGTEDDGFSLMEISYLETSDKIYFLLPMLTLEVKKLSDDKPSKPKWVESKKETPTREPVDYSEAEVIEKDIDDTSIIEFKDSENPPLAPECEAKWDSDKKRDCTNKYIQNHLRRKFNLDLLGEVKQTGKVKIMITFIIDTDGKAINIEATGGPDILNENAVDVIGLLPNFKPATKDGEPINVSCKMPLQFFIAD